MEIKNGFVCVVCENVLDKHKENCLVINGEQRVKLNEGFISFKNSLRQMRVPFKIYADFECILQKNKKYDENGNSDSSWSVKMQDHVPCGFGYKVVDDKFTKDIVIYIGKDCVDQFVDAILSEYDYCKSVMRNHFNKNLIMSMEEEEVFQKANKCCICGKLFELIDEKVRDHCHISGKFRGAAHFSCNANFKISKKVPVVFHNLKGYDGHLIMRGLNSFNVVIDVIPCGLEKYMTITVNRNLVFINSVQFMNCSLDTLVGNLIDKDFKYLSREFSGERLKLVKEKGVYPNEYMNSFKKFDACELSNKDAFFSSLKGKDINNEDYLRATKVWNIFDIKNLGEYHDLYLKTDILLLCDVFEKFIDVCLEYYDLDPCHYFSSPGLAWDAMLKMTGVELKLIDDIDMHLFIEKGMRGGISSIAKRYCKANNKYVKGYDENKDSTMYWDVNNLYGWTMTQYLPYDNFEWMSEKEISEINFDLVSGDSNEGYILEIDLEYPSDLHNLHSDYPLAPEKLKVSDDTLSSYCLSIAKEYGIRVGEVNKLIPNLKKKENYIVHYRNLQLYKSLGMKVVKISKVLKFKQSDWLKKFVMFNIEKRMCVVNRFEKDFFKLMVNSVYGKTMENLRKKVSVKLVNKEKDYVKYVSRPTFVSQKILDKNLVAIHKVKLVLLLNKPIYVGFCVLDVSKLLMYDWHYNYFVKTFDCSLCFTDTDSLVYEIRGVDDVYEKVYKDKDLFDFSDYSKESKFYDNSKKKVIGKMKDEMSGKVISEFVGLKSKMYSLVTVDDEEKIRAKGINKKLRHDEFYDVLFDKKVITHNMKRIQAMVTIYNS